MKNAMFKFSAALTLAAAATSAAYAGGFMLTEQSVAGLGRAYAGSGIVGDDLSAVWYNPAGMVLLPGTQFQMGSVMAYLDLDVETNKGDTDNGAKHGVPIPNMFFTHQMNEDMWFGFGITVPFGMATEYKRDWELADHGMNAEVKVFDFNPNVAWKVNDKLSIGAGMSLQYVTAHFESGVPVGGATGYGRLSADGWAWGGNLGVMWQPTETLRFGLAYRSQVNHHADGTFKAGMKTGPDGIPDLRIPANTSGKGYNLGTYDGQATMSAPHVVTLTGTWEATQALRLSGLVRWTNWASFDSLPITSPAFGRLGQMAETRRAATLTKRSITGRIPGSSRSVLTTQSMMQSRSVAVWAMKSRRLMTTSTAAPRFRILTACGSLWAPPGTSITNCRVTSVSRTSRESVIRASTTRQRVSSSANLISLTPSSWVLSSSTASTDKA